MAHPLAGLAMRAAKADRAQHPRQDSVIVLGTLQLALTQSLDFGLGRPLGP